jgi:threonyl-tRNA synthetase
MIHRALLGSFERFLGILLEDTGGDLPFWLAPVQVAVLPVADRHNPYAQEVAGALRGAGFRVEVDDRTESVGRKIRETELQKVPYMFVVGDREAEGHAVAVRRHTEGDRGTIPLEEALGHLRAELAVL